MLRTICGAGLALLVLAPRLGAGQQAPSWPAQGQLVKEGVALHDKEDYAGAIAKYRAVTPGDTTYALAQSELALSLEAAGQHAEAAEAARHALAINPFEGITYATLADAQEELKQPEAALATYQQGLHLFPYSQTLYYNQGLTQLRQGQTAAALASLQHSLELKPLHANSHRLLALLAAEQGHTSHALLSSLLCLATGDASPAAHSVLVQAERLAQGVPVVLDNERTAPVSPNEAFAELDQLLESKVALQKEYVSKVKFAAAVVKQTQLLVEKFPVDGPATDFWVRAYAPVVAVLRRNDNLVPFTYLILQSADDKSAAQWLKSNKGKVDALVRELVPALLTLREQQQVVGGAPGQRVAGWFSDGELDGLGPGRREQGKFVGSGAWIGVSSAGAVTERGQYNAAGQVTGPWQVLRPDGTPQETLSFDKGVREGPTKEFYPGGQPSLEITYHLGKAEGPATRYNECGARTSTRTLKAGNLEGPYATYYANGQVHLRAVAHADETDGLEEGFYPDGTPEYSIVLAAGKKQGPYATYYPNKAPEKKGTYDQGTLHGPYAEYFAAGTLREDGRFEHGKRAGTWHEYFPGGKPSVEKSYDEAGELHGLYRDYDEQGHLYADTEYAHGRTARLRYYDRAGKTALDQPVKKGRVPVHAIDADGRPLATGTFNDGQFAGEWKWFYPDGQVREISHYDDKGVKAGVSEVFFRDGQVQQRLHYGADGSLDGYFERFLADGQLAQAGYYQAGERQGPWKDYYPTGQLSEEYELHKGLQNGLARSYAPGGKLTQERTYAYDQLRRIATYDSTGRVLTQVDLTPASKEYVLHYPGGQPLYRTALSCYDSYGPVTWLRPDGSVSVSGSLLNDRRYGPYQTFFATGKPNQVLEYQGGQVNGDWQAFYPSGQLRAKGRYANGQQEGEWIFYFDNGQVETVQQYVADELHGPSRRYNPAGELLAEKRYEHGALVSFRGPGAPEAPWQSLANLSGPVQTAFANGRPATAETYAHGEPTGPATLYYAAGGVFRRGAYQHGARVGLLESFYPNGKLMEQEHYLHGELHGRCRYYRPDGTLEREETYLSGERSGPATAYNAAGKPLHTDVYWNQMVYGKK
ncbi:hypothetical protein ACFQ48_08150 [Hymenobacter caeli]|uniref:Antitoxin component YwqK of YwqJK toxin-antitoxin module/Flp pilus assembly protein TadD n=1 Tax=Hymenobacter caeli TaxID=2735894 RepID=A0ABX2FNU6_9BACT|nr:hypothetical protein [Hymenobacter caeli]NRT18216.1 antitoxin component YwqK of YwqJK toxin-antitoxin module/Flp pilus assembly protein TadD [Hymenobacter caeli]